MINCCLRPPDNHPDNRANCQFEILSRFACLFSSSSWRPQPPLNAQWDLFLRQASNKKVFCFEIFASHRSLIFCKFFGPLQCLCWCELNLKSREEQAKQRKKDNESVAVSRWSIAIIIGSFFRVLFMPFRLIISRKIAYTLWGLPSRTKLPLKSSLIFSTAEQTYTNVFVCVYQMNE